jgi:hypothetical protein
VTTYQLCGKKANTNATHTPRPAQVDITKNETERSARDDSAGRKQSWAEAYHAVRVSAAGVGRCIPPICRARHSFIPFFPEKFHLFKRNSTSKPWIDRRCGRVTGTQRVTRHPIAPVTSSKQPVETGASDFFQATSRDLNRQSGEPQKNKGIRR